ncbi:hypothetical protein JEZ13_02925 [bacterium]|nr:hypothetical protein [bacterium]
MKKIFIAIFFVFLLVPVFGAGNERLFHVQFNVGLDVKGTHDRFFNVPYWDDETVMMGYSPSFEVVNQGKYFDIGVGFEYQLPREIKDGNGAEFNFMPIYSVWRITIIPTKARELEAIGHVGYNIFNFNEEYLTGDYSSTGNLYWGAGLSLVLGQRIVMQGLYKQNKANVEYNGTSAEIKNSHITISLGLRL